MNYTLACKTISYTRATTGPDNRAFVKLLAKALELLAEEIWKDFDKLQPGEFHDYLDECWVSALKRSDVIDSAEELQVIMNTDLSEDGVFPMETIGYSEEPKDETVKASLAERTIAYLQKHYKWHALGSFVETFASCVTMHNTFDIALMGAIQNFAGERGWEAIYYNTELQHDLVWR